MRIFAARVDFCSGTRNHTYLEFGHGGGNPKPARRSFGTVPGHRPTPVPVLTRLRRPQIKELAALRVGDVDLRKRRVTIERSVTEVAGKLAWTDRKSSKRRTVPIPRFVASELAVAITGKGAADLPF